MRNLARLRGWLKPKKAALVEICREVMWSTTWRHIMK